MPAPTLSCASVLTEVFASVLVSASAVVKGTLLVLVSEVKVSFAARTGTSERIRKIVTVSTIKNS